MFGHICLYVASRNSAIAGWSVTFVRMCVRLFASIQVTIQEQHLPNFTRIGTAVWGRTNTFAAGSESRTFKDSPTLRYRAPFNNFTQISGKKLIRSSWKFYRRPLAEQP